MFGALGQKIVASREGKRFLLNINCILYFYSEGNEVKMVADNNFAYYVGHTLQFWEEKLLAESFFRCHKGFLVNINNVIEIVPYFNSTLALKFKDNKNIIPVGRKYLKDFKEAISW